jgi:hypothetical protein
MRIKEQQSGSVLTFIFTVLHSEGVHSDNALGMASIGNGRVFGSSKQGMGFKGRAFGKDHMEMTGHALGSN